MPRDDMPQIDLADYAELFAFLNDRGVTVGLRHLPSHMLRPIQCPDKLFPAVEPGQSTKPLLVSKSRDIIDGNHRWAAHVLYSPNVAVPVYRLECETFTAIKLLNDFPKSYRLGDGPQPYRV